MPAFLLRTARRGVLLLLLGLASFSVAAQETSCPPAEADAYLDVNDVRARIFNNGKLFWHGAPHVYEVPQGETAQAIFATTLLLAGKVEGELRAAGSRYGAAEFWPGPLAEDGRPPADCAVYDRFWTLTRDDLFQLDSLGIVSPNVREWPAHLGAPVIDGDGLPEHYAPEAGDRPALVGDQMHWWIMNDAAGPHAYTETPPLPMEVRGTAFAVNRPQSPLSRTTFYRFRFTYHGAAPLDSAYIGLFVDVDLGNFNDDYAGVDTLLHLGYSYNADEVDEGSDGYGSPPPAVGFTILGGPHADTDGRDNDHDGTTDEPGERLGLDAFSCYIKGGGPYGGPTDGLEAYRCLRGLWRNGEPITVGGLGAPDLLGHASEGRVTRYAFPGDPIAGDFWSMENIDGEGTRAFAGDKRFVLGSGPFSMQPGQTEVFTFAIVWERGVDRFDSLRRLRAAAEVARLAAPALLNPPVPAPEVPVASILWPPYPNPAAAATTLRYDLAAAADVRLALYDALGRLVTVLDEGRRPEGIHELPLDARRHAPGLYLVRMNLGARVLVRRLVIVR